MKPCLGDRVRLLRPPHLKGLVGRVVLISDAYQRATIDCGGTEYRTSYRNLERAPGDPPEQKELGIE